MTGFCPKTPSLSPIFAFCLQALGPGSSRLGGSVLLHSHRAVPPAVPVTASRGLGALNVSRAKITRSCGARSMPVVGAGGGATHTPGVVQAWSQGGGGTRWRLGFPMAWGHG